MVRPFQTDLNLLHHPCSVFTFFMGLLLEDSFSSRCTRFSFVFGSLPLWEHGDVKQFARRGFYFLLRETICARRWKSVGMKIIPSFEMKLQESVICQQVPEAFIYERGKTRFDYLLSMPCKGL